MTPEELKRFDGREGRKAFVAVSGKIYDVTESPLWEAGDHQQAHQAGSDLTEELKSAPHVRAVIDRFPQVGELQQPARQSGGNKLWLIAVLLIVLVSVALIFI